MGQAAVHIDDLAFAREALAAGRRDGQDFEQMWAEVFEHIAEREVAGGADREDRDQA